MAGSKEGSQKTKQSLIEKYGPDYFQKIGAIGGKTGRTGGFASEAKDKNGLTGRQRAEKYGSIGGKRSRRPSAILADANIDYLDDLAP